MFVDEGHVVLVELLLAFLLAATEAVEHGAAVLARTSQLRPEAGHEVRCSRWFQMANSPDERFHKIHGA